MHIICTHSISQNQIIVYLYNNYSRGLLCFLLNIEMCSRGGRSGSSCGQSKIRRLTGRRK